MPSAGPIPTPWRASSLAATTTVGLLSKAFLRVACSTEVSGLDEFAELLDQRRDIEKRDRGLLTVSNHVSVLDDPVLWGCLPYRNIVSPENSRWAFGSHDICFKFGPNSLITRFFTAGQTLPTHRLAHSPHGGLFQPTMTQCIRLLSACPNLEPTPLPRHVASPAPPRSSRSPTSYTTTGSDLFPAPAVHRANRHAWVHVFPEGRVHQQAALEMRYFRWGVARLLLESGPRAPDLVPVFAHGLQRVMPEGRRAPRWLPRVAWPRPRVRVRFGARVDAEAVFAGERARWRELVARVARERGCVREEGGEWVEELRWGEEAVGLRIEVARRVRALVEGVRREMGWPDERGEGRGDAENWRWRGKEGEKKDN